MNCSKNLMIGLFLAGGAFFAGCSNKEPKINPSVSNIVENRTARYLERVAEEAELSLREANEEHEIALKKQNAADSISAKNIISQYESGYLKAKAEENKALLVINNPIEYNTNYENALKKYEEIVSKNEHVNDTYDNAVEELEIARGRDVSIAEKHQNDAIYNRRQIVSYRQILNIPASQREKIDSAMLSDIYHFCRDAERKGWGNNISSRLVKHIDSKNQ